MPRFLRSLVLGVAIFAAAPAVAQNALTVIHGVPGNVLEETDNRHLVDVAINDLCTSAVSFGSVLGPLNVPAGSQTVAIHEFRPDGVPCKGDTLLTETVSLGDLGDKTVVFGLNEEGDPGINTFNNRSSLAAAEARAAGTASIIIRHLAWIGALQPEVTRAGTAFPFRRVRFARQVRRSDIPAGNARLTLTEVSTGLPVYDSLGQRVQDGYAYFVYVFGGLLDDEVTVISDRRRKTGTMPPPVKGGVDTVADVLAGRSGFSVVLEGMTVARTSDSDEFIFSDGTGEVRVDFQSNNIAPFGARIRLWGSKSSSEIDVKRWELI